MSFDPIATTELDQFWGHYGTDCDDEAPVSRYGLCVPIIFSTMAKLTYTVARISVTMTLYRAQVP